MDPAIFRAYDARGVYPRQINERVAYALGRAFSRMTGARRVLVGRDVRLSGPSLIRAVALGLEDEGSEVCTAGMVPTPTLYLGVVEGRFDAGVQVTASHNPPEWNGFKFVLGNGETVSEGQGMERLKEIAMSIGETEPPRRDPAFSQFDAKALYLERVKSLVRLKRRVRMVVDFSNGAGCEVGKQFFEGIGIDLIPMNDVPDGTFPAHLPEPTTETMRELVEAVKEHGAEVGAGIDGDADRAVFVDDRGRLLEGDVTLAFLVQNSDVKGKVVYDVSSSSIVEEVIRGRGCEPVICRVGRAFMLRKVREVRAVLGAEKSNHVYFSELYGFDDGIFAVAKVAEALSRSESKLSDFVDRLPKVHASTIYTVDVGTDDVKWRAMELIAKRMTSSYERVLTIDGVKAYLPEGWVLIRPSNTMPQIKYVAEARTEETLNSYLRMAKTVIDEAVRGVRA
ncbi:MAG: phosphomannomutase/phosphoglucomutase [Thaumarchaeota archaeon]|nr:phosphomannomutase/phosphoglucomutase [Candidatus Calditenuaceae archaeon]MDW8187318.1 phosphomannomutase/phosphoglucomutase [Nitrososphaerota archaeon]